MCFELTPISRVQEMGGSSFDVGAFSVLWPADRSLTAGGLWPDCTLTAAQFPFKKIVLNSGQKSLFLFLLAGTITQT